MSLFDGWNCGNDSSDDAKMVEREEPITYEYTEHEAVATFVDGTTSRWVFDYMKEKDHGIVLGEYQGPATHNGPRSLKSSISPASSETFATIPYSNLLSFETVERRDRSMEGTRTDMVPKGLFSHEGDSGD